MALLKDLYLAAFLLNVFLLSIHGRGKLIVRGHSDLKKNRSVYTTEQVKHFHSYTHK